MHLFGWPPTNWLVDNQQSRRAVMVKGTTRCRASPEREKIVSGCAQRSQSCTPSVTNAACTRRFYGSTVILREASQIDDPLRPGRTGLVPGRILAVIVVVLIFGLSKSAVQSRWAWLKGPALLLDEVRSIYVSWCPCIQHLAVNFVCGDKQLQSEDIPAHSSTFLAHIATRT